MLDGSESVCLIRFCVCMAEACIHKCYLSRWILWVMGRASGGQILSVLADILSYLANGDGVSDTFKRLISRTGLFGLVKDFFEILNVTGCDESDAAAGAILSFVVGAYLTKLSFILVASILNPILLVAAVFAITQIIGYIQSLVRQGVTASCRG